MQEQTTQTLQGFTSLDTGVLVFYLLAVLVIGIVFSSKEFQGKAFFKGDGTIPWYVTCVSIFATLLSPISFLSIPGISYSHTWLYWWAQIGMIIAIFLTMKYFLPIYSRLKIDTAYHYLEKRFCSKGLRVLGAVVFIFYQLGRMSIIMYLPSLVLAKLTGFSVDILILAMGIIAIIYSYTGGLKAVLYTDFIQGIVLIVGILLVFIMMLSNISGGFGDIYNELANNHKFLAENEPLLSSSVLSDSILIVLIGGGLTTFASYVSSQDVVQRFTTTTDIKQLNKMTIGNGVLSIFAATLFYLVGTGLYVFYHQHPDLMIAGHDKPDMVFAHYIAYQLPQGITGILLAAIYAAAQSTLSTGINSVATSYVLDIQSVFSKNTDINKSTKLAQWISLFVGALSIIFAIVLAHSDIKSAFVWFNTFAGLVLGALAGIFILGAFSKTTNAMGAFLGFIVATAVVVYVKFNVPSVAFWTYVIITIVTTWIVAHAYKIISGSKFIAPEDSTH